MQSVTLHSHVGSDGILQLKVPPDFTNTDLKIRITVQQMLKPSIETSSMEIDHSEPTRLINEGGILVADGELLDDVTDVVQQDRERRISVILQRVMNYDDSI